MKMFDDLDSDSLSQINFGTPLYSNGTLCRYRWGRKMNIWDGHPVVEEQEFDSNLAFS